MKPPYVMITARCDRHGTFSAERKPNRRRDVGSGKPIDGLYDAVKCPKCPFWATIISQVLVTADQAETPESVTMPLPGMEN